METRVRSYRRRVADGNVISVGEHSRQFRGLIERVKSAVQEKIGYTGQVVGGYVKEYAHYSSYRIFVKVPNAGPFYTAIGRYVEDGYLDRFDLDIFPNISTKRNNIETHGPYKHGANFMIDVNIQERDVR